MCGYGVAQDVEVQSFALYILVLALTVQMV